MCSYRFFPFLYIKKCYSFSYLSIYHFVLYIYMYFYIYRNKYTLFLLFFAPKIDIISIYFSIYFSIYSILCFFLYRDSYISIYGFFLCADFFIYHFVLYYSIYIAIYIYIFFLLFLLRQWILILHYIYHITCILRNIYIIY